MLKLRRNLVPSDKICPRVVIWCQTVKPLPELRTLELHCRRHTSHYSCNNPIPSNWSWQRHLAYKLSTASQVLSVIMAPIAHGDANRSGWCRVCPPLYWSRSSHLRCSLGVSGQQFNVREFSPADASGIGRHQCLQHAASWTAAKAPSRRVMTSRRLAIQTISKMKVKAENLEICQGSK